MREGIIDCVAVSEGVVTGVILMLGDSSAETLGEAVAVREACTLLLARGLVDSSGVTEGSGLTEGSAVVDAMGVLEIVALGDTPRDVDGSAVDETDPDLEEIALVLAVILGLAEGVLEMPGEKDSKGDMENWAEKVGVEEGDPG